MGAFTRREFLTALGMMAGGGVLGYTPDITAHLFNTVWGEDWVEVPTGPESHVLTLCRLCPAGCGIQVRLVGERPVKIEGNPYHPVNRGTLCPKGQAGLVALYDPDRIKNPLRRLGSRGEGKWEEIPWSEAINLIVNRLKELRKKNAPHRLAVLIPDEEDLTSLIVARFCHQFGTPNLVKLPDGLDSGCLEAFYLMQGRKRGVVYDLKMANYILSFGMDFLQSFRSPVEAMAAYSSLRRGRITRGKLVQVEARHSVTATKADEWIPVKPGMEGALALGMAHFIIREGLYDKNFVEKYTLGFDNWRDAAGIEHRGFRSLVLQNYAPLSVSEITGVPVDVILRLAKEFATQGPALAIGARGNIYQQMAIHSLNALVGSIDRPGGVLTVKNPPLIDFNSADIDETARRGNNIPALVESEGKFLLPEEAFNSFTEKVKEGKPYALDTLFIVQTNPLFPSYSGAAFIQALEKIPFIVSFSPYMDETTLYADLVLPDHSYLEKWQCHFSFTLQGLPFVGIGRPVVKPRLNTRDTTEVIISLAQGLGDSVSKVFPWKEGKEVIFHVMKKVYDLSRGDLFVPEVEEDFLKELGRRGWRAPGYATYEDFWEGVQEKGGWWDPVYAYEEWDLVFKTPSRKFEFYSQLLKTQMPPNALRKRGDDIAYLPHWEEESSEKGFPYYLKLFQPLVLAGLFPANNPYLNDLASLYAPEKWHTYAEINTHTAEQLGIKNGDLIYLESPYAKIKVRARLTQGTMPEVISVPLGWGHKSLGRWAKGIGEDGGKLVVPKRDALSGGVFITKVKIYKA